MADQSALLNDTSQKFEIFAYSKSQLSSILTNINMWTVWGWEKPLVYNGMNTLVSSIQTVATTWPKWVKSLAGHKRRIVRKNVTTSERNSLESERECYE